VNIKIKRKGRLFVTKSKGVGRGGVRTGSGRKSKAAKADWDTIAREYFAGRGTIDDICERFGVSHGDLLAYAASNNWVTPRVPAVGISKISATWRALWLGRSSTKGRRQSQIGPDVS
jgi:hypothetical protein